MTQFFVILNVWNPHSYSIKLMAKYVIKLTEVNDTKTLVFNLGLDLFYFHGMFKLIADFNILL